MVPAHVKDQSEAVLACAAESQFHQGAGTRRQTCHCEAQGNTDAADILGAGEALAYGVGSAVAVADVRRMKLATVLAGGHRGAAVTAVAWCVLRHLTDSLRMFSEAHPVKTAVL